MNKVVSLYFSDLTCSLHSWPSGTCGGHVREGRGDCGPFIHMKFCWRCILFFKDTIPHPTPYFLSFWSNPQTHNSPVTAKLNRGYELNWDAQPQSVSQFSAVRVSGSAPTFSSESSFCAKNMGSSFPWRHSRQWMRSIISNSVLRCYYHSWPGAGWGSVSQVTLRRKAGSQQMLCCF